MDTCTACNEYQIHRVAPSCPKHEDKDTTEECVEREDYYADLEDARVESWRYRPMIHLFKRKPKCTHINAVTKEAKDVMIGKPCYLCHIALTGKEKCFCLTHGEVSHCTCELKKL